MTKRFGFFRWRHFSEQGTSISRFWEDVIQIAMNSQTYGSYLDALVTPDLRARKPSWAFSEVGR